VLKLEPALQPSETFKIVSALSDAGPAPVPATMFPCESCVKPGIVTVATPAAPDDAVATTPSPTKFNVATLPAVPTVPPSSLTVRPPIAPVPSAVIPVKY